MENVAIQDGALIHPIISERACGGFLALSPQDAPVRIGVVGETAEEAQSNFAAAIARWTELLQEGNP
jgi:hypothetical protein